MKRTFATKSHEEAGEQDSILHRMPPDILGAVIDACRHGQVYTLKATSSHLYDHVRDLVDKKDPEPSYTWKKIFDVSFRVLEMGAMDLFLWMLPDGVFSRDKDRIVGILMLEPTVYSFIMENNADNDVRNGTYVVAQWRKKRPSQVSDGLVDGKVDNWGSIKTRGDVLNFGKTVKRWESGIRGWEAKVLVTDLHFYRYAKMFSDDVKQIKPLN